MYLINLPILSCLHDKKQLIVDCKNCNGLLIKSGGNYDKTYLIINKL